MPAASLDKRAVGGGLGAAYDCEAHTRCGILCGKMIFKDTQIKRNTSMRVHRTTFKTGITRTLRFLLYPSRLRPGTLSSLDGMMQV